MLIGALAAASTALTMPFNRVVAVPRARVAASPPASLPSALSPRERAWREKEIAANRAALGIQE
jgi:hypothetical protein